MFCMNRSITLASVIAFGIPGVKEHAHFLKDVKDARMIRTRILECLRSSFVSPTIRDSLRNSSGFEQANQPILTEIQRRNLLHFAIVGTTRLVPFPTRFTHFDGRFLTRIRRGSDWR